MLLPKIPYTLEKTKRMITKFLGLNLTENTQEGQFSDTLGLSSEKYPVLTQRKGRYKSTTHSNVTNLFEWDGKKVVVDGTMLYFDGTAIVNVTTGKKQFAVVNTHLIVMPDKIDIDMTSEYYDDQNIRHFKYSYLGGSLVTASADTTTFSNGNTIAGQLSGFQSHIQSNKGWEGYKDGPAEYTSFPEKPCFYTYGTNRAAVEACWNGSAWTSGLDALKQVHWYDRHHGATLANGDIFIPSQSGGSFEIVAGAGLAENITRYPNTASYNNAGYYMVLNTTAADEGAVWRTSMHYTSSSYYEEFSLSKLGFDLYKASAQKWSEKLYVGDLVSCTGTTSGTYNFTDARVESINDSTNTMVVKAKNPSTGVWDQNPFPTNTQAYNLAITFTRKFPNLDYICERGNRLWGVSNEDKTIYASSLGLPNFMYNVGDNDSDAYNVAVGSEGEFTAICSYGDATCCWKENGVHKVLGDYPSNFYINEYKIAGVQKDSEKSLCIINETLFYKGVNGVFTYTGSTPSLISGVLGRDDFNSAVGGSDGERYYISMKDRVGTGALYTYDLVNGIWLKEDNIYADGFTKLSGVHMGTLIEDQFYMASGGYEYKMGLNNDEVFDWMAEFCPFYTSVRSSSSYARTFGKMGYSKILLEMDMTTGSRIQIFVKEDNKPYRLAYTQASTRDYVLSVPIRIGRCDRYQVKLVGRGRVVIRAMQRVYKVGSEV